MDQLRRAARHEESCGDQNFTLHRAEANSVPSPLGNKDEDLSRCRKLSPEQRGYGHAHRTRRRGIAPMVEAGIVRCARCGELIRHGEPWALGHLDGTERTVCSGPEPGAATERPRRTSSNAFGPAAGSPNHVGTFADEAPLEEAAYSLRPASAAIEGRISEAASQPGNSPSEPFIAMSSSSVTIPVLSATCAPECAPVAPPSGRFRADSGGRSLRRTAVPKRLVNGCFSQPQGDGPCRDRTCDLGIKSPLLYQLS